MKTATLFLIFSLCFLGFENAHAKSGRDLLMSLVKKKSFKWLCYYGYDKKILSLPDYKVLVLEADAIGNVEKKKGRLLIAYMSIGEAAEGRWFRELLEDKPYFLGKNDAWGNSRRVDPRNEEWQNLLVNEIAKKILDMGYDGLMLDNTDIGEYLECKDPELYKGAKEATAQIIRKLRNAYPNAVLITNGGLATAAMAAESLDAVINESSFSKWLMDGEKVVYQETNDNDKQWLKPLVEGIKIKGLPLLSLEYVNPNDKKQQLKITKLAKQAGMHPFVSDKSLTAVPLR